MFQKSVVLVTAVALVAVGVSFMTAEEKAPKGPDREADKVAVAALIKANVEAFNSRDAAAIAALWTADGEYVRNNGDAVSGRADIQKGYAEFFKTLKGKPALEVQTDSLRFPSADTAVSQVTLRLKNEQGEVIGSSWRDATLVREGGQWKVAIIQEWDRDTVLDDGVKDLEWLIGTWTLAAKDRAVTITYEWDEQKVFIRGKYSIKDGTKVVESGTQMIGKDNADGGVRSWVFQADGGFGGGLWARDGKKWTVDFYGVTPDGKRLTSTVVYVRVDANTFTWQSVNQAVNDEPIADSQPIKVIKQ